MMHWQFPGCELLGCFSTHSNGTERRHVSWKLVRINGRAHPINSAMNCEPKPSEDDHVARLVLRPPAPDPRGPDVPPAGSRRGPASQGGCIRGGKPPFRPFHPPPPVSCKLDVWMKTCSLQYVTGRYIFLFFEMVDWIIFHPPQI